MIAKRFNKILILFLFSLKLSAAPAANKISAGILPYTYDKYGKLLFLIGEEKNGYWADFGGYADPKDKDVQTTAAREFTEETRAVFGLYALKHNLVQNSLSPFAASIAYIQPRITHSVLLDGEKKYALFLAHVAFIPANRFKSARKTPHYEKIDYAWVPAVALADAVAQSSRFHAYFGARRIRYRFVDLLKSKAFKKALRAILTISENR